MALLIECPNGHRKRKASFTEDTLVRRDARIVRDKNGVTVLEISDYPENTYSNDRLVCVECGVEFPIPDEVRHIIWGWAEDFDERFGIKRTK